MKTILSICLLLISATTFAQEQHWTKTEYGQIPDGLKDTNAVLVFIMFSDEEIKDLGLHEHYTTTIYNECIAKYTKKYYAGPLKIMSMTEFTNNKEDIDYVFLPAVYEKGRAEGIVPRLFGIVDVQNETIYRRESTIYLPNAHPIHTEIRIEISSISKKRVIE